MKQRIMAKNKQQEDRSFGKFLAVCYILGFISLLLVTVYILVGYVWAFGIPNFSNLDEQRSFCFKYGGIPMEPSRQSYNEMICVFHLNEEKVVDLKLGNKEPIENRIEELEKSGLSNDASIIISLGEREA